jgi:hypothetical protein
MAAKGGLRHASSVANIVHRAFRLNLGNSVRYAPGGVRSSEVTMRAPLVIVFVALVLVAAGTLAVMNNACKSSHHEWFVPSTMWHHKTQLSSDD